MRPVIKLAPKETIGNFIIQKEYAPYGTAFKPLKEMLGKYCSYCEVWDSTIEIEHIIPQSQVPHLKNKYRNLLFSCSVCNGKSNKANKYINIRLYLWPHIHNTAFAFVYGQGGLIDVNPNLIEPYKSKAISTLNLIGLNKHKSVSDNQPTTDRDERWLHRFDAWQKALEFKGRGYSPEVVSKVALERGYFSVWCSVFNDSPEHLLALIEGFNANKLCFDSETWLPKPI